MVAKTGLVIKVVQKLSKAWVAEALAEDCRATVAVAVVEREQRHAQQLLLTSGLRTLGFSSFNLHSILFVPQFLQNTVFNQYNVHLLTNRTPFLNQGLAGWWSRLPGRRLRVSPTMNAPVVALTPSCTSSSTCP